MQDPALNISQNDRIESSGPFFFCLFVSFPTESQNCLDWNLFTSHVSYTWEPLEMR